MVGELPSATLFKSKPDNAAKNGTEVLRIHGVALRRPERQAFRQELVLQPFGGEFGGLYRRTELLGLAVWRGQRSALQSRADDTERPDDLFAPWATRFIQ